jgi:hypothetical protein
VNRADVGEPLSTSYEIGVRPVTIGLGGTFTCFYLQVQPGHNSTVTRRDDALVLQ